VIVGVFLECLYDVCNIMCVKILFEAGPFESIFRMWNFLFFSIFFLCVRVR